MLTLQLATKFIQYVLLLYNVDAIFPIYTLQFLQGKCSLKERINEKKLKYYYNIFLFYFILQLLEDSEQYPEEQQVCFQ